MYPVSLGILYNPLYPVKVNDKSLKKPNLSLSFFYGSRHNINLEIIFSLETSVRMLKLAHLLVIAYNRYSF